MQTEFFFPLKAPETSARTSLLVGGVRVPVALVRHRAARRYILRLTSQGVARVTIPRGGSIREACRFAESQTAWIERQLRRVQESAWRRSPWQLGCSVLFRGEHVVLAPVIVDGAVMVPFAGVLVPAASGSADLRPTLERLMRSLACKELPPRVFELGLGFGLTVRSVSVRDQRTRWGSCSRRATISLNWRLIQMPGEVRDYIMIHELMHLREMNHSRRFWREVAAACPDYERAERWLRQHREILGRRAAAP